ncbi:MAG: TetR/AcrR family transcriptional regulator [Dysgonamonadaceae bacterium]|jgi:AcrR family transcriptional regulator|nr:TetR/AcrR family transcriptional regulator [Dysgonamonadaceae bacterium]
MELNQKSTEQLILETAEKVFMAKGYSGARCMDIADEAGINHAMLHYYFRTKETLFNRIFEEKVNQLLHSFVITLDDNQPFLENIKNCIEKHFEFLEKQPGLPFFVFREVIQDKAKKDFIKQKIMMSGIPVFQKLNQAIQTEIAKEAIRPVSAQDLVINLGSLNVFAFIAAQMLFDISNGITPECKSFLDSRKQNNVDVIINSLKI